MDFDQVARHYRDEGTLTSEEIIWCLGLKAGEEQARLFALADEIRAIHLGEEVHLRAIIEFSNYCVRDCAYCGINRTNHRVYRYRMEPEEIKAAAREAAALGFRTVVLQSGEDPFYTRDVLAEIVYFIKTLDMAVTLSVGERPFTDYAAWRQAGADRYLLKFETSDPDLYASLHGKGTLTRRLECLEHLKRLGYQTGSGNMVGLPGQTLETLADDLLLMASLHLDMAGIGPFLPHPETPLASSRPGDFALSLNVLALARLLMPGTHLPATTALGSMREDGRSQGLNAGANVIMLNATPVRYRQHYSIYPAKAEVTSTIAEMKAATEEMLRRMGRKMARDYGHGPAYAWHA